MILHNAIYLREGRNSRRGGSGYILVRGDVPRIYFGAGDGFENTQRYRGLREERTGFLEKGNGASEITKQRTSSPTS